MREYFGMRQATAAVLVPDGWLDTGDLGVPGGRRDRARPAGPKDLILLERSQRLAARP
jgi:hypothetical protein